MRRLCTRVFQIQEYENAFSAAFQAAQSAELLDRKREAVDWYKQVTGERSLRAIMRQAFLLAKLGDIDDARSLLAQLRIQSDREIQSQSYQAEAQILTGCRRKIIRPCRYWSNALAISPEEVALRYMRGLLGVTMGQLEQAKDDFRQIIASAAGKCCRP